MIERALRERRSAGHRFRLVDTMRGLAALSIVAYHVSFDFRLAPGSVWAYASQRNGGPPATGVVLFFLISGFVLYRPFLVARLDGRPLPALLPYAVRRFARVVPAYWLALLVVALWQGMSYVFTPVGAIRYFGFLQLYGSVRTADGGLAVAWSLCVEVTFYVLLPLLAHGVRRLPTRSLLASEAALLVGMVVTSLVWQIVICSTMTPTKGGWNVVDALWTLPGSLDLFAAGMALALLSVLVEHQQEQRRPAWVRGLDRVPWLPWVAAAAVLWGVGAVQGLSHHTLLGWWMLTHEAKAFACVLLLAPVVLGDERRGWLRRLLGWRPLVWIGGVSYGIYLWHLPLLDQLGPQLVGQGQLVTDLVVGAISIALGSASFLLVERPAQRVARALTRDRTRTSRPDVRSDSRLPATATQSAPHSTARG